MPLQIIFVTSLSNKCYSYHLWLLVITKSEKKEKFVINLNQISNIQSKTLKPCYNAENYLKVFADKVLRLFKIIFLPED